MTWTILREDTFLVSSLFFYLKGAIELFNNVLRREEIFMENSNPFSICFNMLKLKYSVYDESISSLNVLQPTDKVNVFLNIETILNYLSTIKDLEQKLVLNPSFRVDMVADLINVAAHYKEFFKNNGLDTKEFLYKTHLTSQVASSQASNKHIHQC